MIKECFGYDSRWLKAQQFRYYHGRWQSQEIGWLDKNTLDDGSYIKKIEMLRDASGDISGFSVRARPKEWGVTGFRSYLVEMDFWPPANPNETPPTFPMLTTYATLEDRDATVDDPIVWDWDWSAPPVQTVWTGW